MTLKSMKELSKPCTISIPQDSPMYAALMSCMEKGKEEDEHKINCLEADLEETSNTLLKKISDLEKENKKLKEEKEKYFGYLKDKDLECENQREIVKTCEAEIKKLKEENKNLKCYNTEECNARQADYDEKCDECEGLEEEIEELKEENKNLKKVSGVKTDLILNLFQEMVEKADIDDGLSISKKYGHKYIDEWNKTYDDLIKETIDTINKCHFDPTGGDLYLQFYNHDNIEFRFHNGSEEESEDS